MTERDQQRSDVLRTLLGECDLGPVEVFNRNGSSRFILTCEHAGRAVPAALGDLGVSRHDMDRHIAWDIGAGGLARRLAELMDAVLVMQNYSRLVIDCNRPLDADDAIPGVSDGTHVPGNMDLTDEMRHSRYREIHEPYHHEISRILDERTAKNTIPTLVSVHSFAPHLDGQSRPWDIGLLYNRDDRLARETESAFRRLGEDIDLAFNEPYSISNDSDYTIPVHGEERGIPHVLLELRNDQLTTGHGQRVWASRLHLVLTDIKPVD